jgi:HD superfamily phosphohydrolase
MDPVHGGIHFFEHEKTVIDHPLFQRLRSILQNDMLFLVFPGATHSRFQHSIGAMHIAGRAFKEMVRSYLVDAKKSGNIRMNDSQREAIQYFNACLRLAALLHDTGHAPFSHQFETAAPIHNMLASPTTISALWPNDSWRKYYKTRPEQLTHEHYSVWCADRILRDMLQADAAPDLEIEDIIGLFETTNCAPTAKFTAYSRALLSLFLRSGATMSKFSDARLAAEIQRLFRTLISGELDVDKMDYLLRDSFFSGCRYGIYNLDHLLSTLRVGFDLEHEWFGLAISQKGLGPLEDFVNARFQLYLQLYSHKTVVGFKWLLNQAIGEVVAKSHHKMAVQTALTTHTDFALFTDAYFWEALRAHSRDRPQSACGRLIRRERLQYLKSDRDLSGLKKKQETTKLLKDGHKVAMWESEAKFSKISGTYEHLKLLIKNRTTGAREIDDIKRHSAFFEKFRNTVITHFFVNPLNGVQPTAESTSRLMPSVGHVKKQK